MSEMLATGRDALVALAMLAVVFIALGLAFRGKAAIAAAWEARSEIRTNFAFWLFDALLVTPFVALPAVLLGKWLGVPHLPAMPNWLALALAVVAGDLIGYWRHRLQHSRWLWPAHSVHHSDRHLSWLTLVRMHPLDRLGTATIDSFGLMALGFPPFAIIANGAIRNFYGHFIHSDQCWSFGPAARLLISPVAHRWHHSRDISGVNFATIFSLWDRAFGTFMGSTAAPARMGIDEDSRNFIGELLRPFDALRHPPASPEAALPYRDQQATVTTAPNES